MKYSVQKTDDIAACIALRIAVFVEEQQVPMDDEIDDLDDVAMHYLARDPDGKPVGTARIYEVGDVGKIGRVCVVASARGTGLGRALIDTCLRELQSHPHLTTIRIGAQDHAIGFYESFGFKVVGDGYLDGGIPHHIMVRAL
ncbi:GNAT family N-acetyltransferase [Celeribacter arenosi]|uniref:GNAT family N-acetyltransferase n=1 Tax=Celeribacter arenosi TaxID=792649 RepID=A0ABP7K030_9RHOB